MRQAPVPPPPPASVHQLKVTLEGLEPPVWREFLIPSDASLEQLHEVIQTVMGWDNGHMHEFEGKNGRYSNTDYIEDQDLGDERTARVAETLPRKRSKLHYEYDFGDSWGHAIVVEAVVKPGPAGPMPVCLAGARACPPDDCGGVWGYLNLLATLSDPASPNYEDMIEWAGEIDPERFDLVAVNKHLTELAKYWKKRTPRRVS